MTSGKGQGMAKCKIMETERQRGKIVSWQLAMPNKIETNVENNQMSDEMNGMQ